MSAAAGAILALSSVFLVVVVIFICAYCSALSERDASSSVELNGGSAPTTDHVTEGDESGQGQLLDEVTILSYPRLRCSRAAIDTDACDGLSNCCSICLSNYQETDIVRVLPKCMHFFHLKCIDPWLKLNLNCPICRKQLV